MIYFDLVMVFFISWLVAYLLAPVVVKMAASVNLMDEVNDRSAHEIPTPRGGGLIFIITVTLGWLVNAIFHIYTLPVLLNTIFVLSILNSLLGLLDNQINLVAWQRFLMQVLLVSYPAIHMPLIFTFLPAGIQYILYIVSWVWFINLFNFMDGTDGYAAQESIFILLLLAMLNPVVRVFSICLAGGCLGFLRVNYPKAKIFMGDVGSYFLGFLLFGLMLMTLTHNVSLLLPCVSISLLFTLDATYTLLKRIYKRQRFWIAHRSHWYQRAYNLGYSHMSIFWIGVLSNVVLSFVVLISYHFYSNWLGLLLSFIFLSVVALFIKNKEKPVIISAEAS